MTKSKGELCGAAWMRALLVGTALSAAAVPGRVAPARNRLERRLA